MGVVKLECHQCGSAECALLGGEHEDSWIACRACGAHLITFGQLRDEIARQARDFATISIRKALGLNEWRQDNDEPTAVGVPLCASALARDGDD